MELPFESHEEHVAMPVEAEPVAAAPIEPSGFGREFDELLARSQEESKDFLAGMSERQMPRLRKVTGRNA